MKWFKRKSEKEEAKKVETKEEDQFEKCISEPEWCDVISCAICGKEQVFCYACGEYLKYGAIDEEFHKFILSSGQRYYYLCSKCLKRVEEYMNSLVQWNVEKLHPWGRIAFVTPEQLKKLIKDAKLVAKPELASTCKYDGHCPGLFGVGEHGIAVTAAHEYRDEIGGLYTVTYFIPLTFVINELKKEVRR